jgi:hypothetical protein
MFLFTRVHSSLNTLTPQHCTRPHSSTTTHCCYHCTPVATGLLLPPSHCCHHCTPRLLPLDTVPQHIITPCFSPPLRHNTRSHVIFLVPTIGRSSELGTWLDFAHFLKWMWLDRLNTVSNEWRMESKECNWMTNEWRMNDQWLNGPMTNDSFHKGMERTTKYRFLRLRLICAPHVLYKHLFNIQCPIRTHFTSIAPHRGGWSGNITQ